MQATANNNTTVDAPVTDIQQVMQAAFDAFNVYRKKSAAGRAAFMDAVAVEIENNRQALVAIAHKETNLPLARLDGEITRTTNQLRLFSALLMEGSWVEASIDTDGKARDLRKMLVPTGPVIVFGASNFPFAFSTAGGDTASALAAGCSVVIKGHSAHAETSLLMFAAMQKAIMVSGMHPATVQHVMGAGNTVGKELVMHPYAKGVGFTGSFAGGQALVGYAHQREIPIPVFAEMSSINPVVFYPDTLSKNAATLAATFAASITMGVGQFCTNPGLLIGIKSLAFDGFLTALAAEIVKVQPQKMLHSGIQASYKQGVAKMLEQQGIGELARSCFEQGEMEGAAVVAKVSSEDFLANTHFTEEVFGPYSLAVICNDKQQLVEVLRSLKGQLTSTIVGTEDDIDAYGDVIEWQHALAGRIIVNTAPTGVDVCASMVHGGPFPATTDARFTSVGSSAIRRWVRPVCLQNFSDKMLPAELKNSNPLGILRLVNNSYTREAITIS